MVSIALGPPLDCYWGDLETFAHPRHTFEGLTLRWAGGAPLEVHKPLTYQGDLRLET